MYIYLFIYIFLFSFRIILQQRNTLYLSLKRETIKGRKKRKKSLRLAGNPGTDSRNLSVSWTDPPVEPPIGKYIYIYIFFIYIYSESVDRFRLKKQQFVKRASFNVFLSRFCSIHKTVPCIANCVYMCSCLYICVCMTHLLVSFSSIFFSFLQHLFLKK